MGSAGIEVQQCLSLSAEVFNQPLFHVGFGVVALLQVPIARQSQVKIDVMALAGAPRAEMVKVDPLGTTNTLQSGHDTAQDRLIGFIHQVADGLAQ